MVNSQQQQQQQIIDLLLPAIRTSVVVGANGTSTSVTATLRAAGRIKEEEVQGASFPLPITMVTFVPTWAAYGPTGALDGAVGGTFQTVDFSAPISQWVNNSSAINNQAGSSGFLVKGVNVYDAVVAASADPKDTNAFIVGSATVIGELLYQVSELFPDKSLTLDVTTTLGTDGNSLTFWIANGSDLFVPSTLRPYEEAWNKTVTDSVSKGVNASNSNAGGAGANILKFDSGTLSGTGAEESAEAGPIVLSGPAPLTFTIFGTGKVNYSATGQMVFGTNSGTSFTAKKLANSGGTVSTAYRQHANRDDNIYVGNVAAGIFTDSTGGPADDWEWGVAIVTTGTDAELKITRRPEVVQPTK